MSPRKNLTKIFASLLMLFQACCSQIYEQKIASSPVPALMIGLSESSKLTLDNFESTSIENIIMSLSVEPLSRKTFVDMVNHAREELSENKYFGVDKLYIGGDGLRGSSLFELDRNRKILKVTYKVENSIPPFTDIYYLHFTEHGWIQSHSKMSGSKLREFVDLNHVKEYWQGVGG